MNLKRHLSYAQGYLDLGLVAEADAELQQIPAPLNDTPEVVSVRMAVLQEQNDWAGLAGLAAAFVKRVPEEAAGWITWAYATRRAKTLVQAEKILLEAEVHHPIEPTIQFNLGCYACLRGDLATAKRRVDRAVALEPKFSQAASTDPDLAALRALSGDARKRAN